MEISEATMLSDRTLIVDLGRELTQEESDWINHQVMLQGNAFILVRQRSLLVPERAHGRSVVETIKNALKRSKLGGK